MNGPDDLARARIDALDTRVGDLTDRVGDVTNMQVETLREVRGLRDLIGSRFDAVDHDHARAQQALAAAAKPPTLRDSFIAALPLIISILVAVIGALGLVLAAQWGGP